MIKLTSLTIFYLLDSVATIRYTGQQPKPKLIKIEIENRINHDHPNRRNLN